MSKTTKTVPETTPRKDGDYFSASFTKSFVSDSQSNTSVFSIESPAKSSAKSTRKSTTPITRCCLCIIDGLGINEKEFGNAVKAANMVNLESAMKDYPSTALVASGPEVGLVDPKDAGNSEVGHNAIGAGQIIKQGLALLDEQFETGAIFESDGWKAIRRASQSSKLNILCLISNGRTHSDIEHMFKVLKQCAKENIKVAIHAIADGRDVSTQSACKYIDQTNEVIKKTGVNAKIVTVSGRGTLWMDRYKGNTPIITRGFEVVVEGKAPHTKDIKESIQAEYKARPAMTDETIPPFVLEPDWLVKNGEGVLLLNYRADRALQTCALWETGEYITKEQFEKIDKCVFAGAVEYDSELGIPKNYLCPPPIIKNTLAEHLCKHNIRQYTVAETVKYGHMTMWFNGNKSQPHCEKLETWVEIKSDGHLAPEFDRAPKMKARLITDAVIDAIKSDKFDFIRLNISNPDMVGHTGVWDAVMIALKEVDDCLGDLFKVCKDEKVNFILTSDHGNAEEMLEPNGKPKSTHTANLVPCIILPFAGTKVPKNLEEGLGLTNVAATVCKLLGVPVSEHFNKPLF